MPFDIQRHDVTVMDVHAVVNSTGQTPSIGQGVEKKINDAAGPLLFSARKAFGQLNISEPVITQGYNLKATWVIHVVAPVYVDGSHQEEIRLYETYMNVLGLARKNQISTIAIPLITSGNLGFPKGLALKIAIKAIKTFLEDDEMDVYLIVYDEKAYQASLTFFDRVRSYLEDEDTFDNDSEILPVADMFDKQPSRLVEREMFDEDMFDPDQGFVESLFDHIDRLGLDDVTVYKKANIDRKLFSKMKSNLDYQPSKRTAIAFALALELSLEDTITFIARAGYALSSSSKFDLIIRYMILHRTYDLYEVNQILFAFKQKTLGSLD